MNHAFKNRRQLTFEGEIPSLNGIRALAVCIVLISHAGFGHIIPGGFGVTVFFFLSGYLITTLLLKEFTTKNHLDIKNFYIRRFLRLTPPLLVTLTIIYFCVITGVSDGGVTFSGLTSQLLYFANYYGIYFQQNNSIPAGTGILWSLAVEEHFYLIYPVILIFCLRLRGNPGSLLCLSFLCLIVLLWRINLALSPEFFEERIYYATDTRIDSILFGCLLAIGYNPLAFGAKNNEMSCKHWLVILVAMGVLITTFIYRDIIFRQTVRYTLQGLALMPLFYFAISRYQHWLFSILSTPLIRKIGIYSYSIYLIHLFIISLILKATNQQITPIYLLISSMGISFFYGFLMHNYIEKYFYQIRKKII